MIKINKIKYSFIGSLILLFSMLMSAKKVTLIDVRKFEVYNEVRVFGDVKVWERRSGDQIIYKMIKDEGFLEGYNITPSSIDRKMIPVHSEYLYLGFLVEIRVNYFLGGDYSDLISFANMHVMGGEVDREVISSIINNFRIYLQE